MEVQEHRDAIGAEYNQLSIVDHILGSIGLGFYAALRGFMVFENLTALAKLKLKGFMLVERAVNPTWRQRLGIEELTPDQYEQQSLATAMLADDIPATVWLAISVANSLGVQGPLDVVETQALARRLTSEAQALLKFRVEALHRMAYRGRTN